MTRTSLSKGTVLSKNMGDTMMKRRQSTRPDKDDSLYKLGRYV